MQNLHLYLLLAQSITRHGAGPWVFTLVTDDGQSVDLYSADQETEVSCLHLTSPGDSMSSVWVVNPEGCMVFPEVSPSSDIQDLAESIATYGFPQWYASGDLAASAALAG